jgi:hypothetical protein
MDRGSRQRRKRSRAFGTDYIHKKMTELSRNSTDANLIKVHGLHDESHYHHAKSPAIIKNA